MTESLSLLEAAVSGAQTPLEKAQALNALAKNLHYEDSTRALALAEQVLALDAEQPNEVQSEALWQHQQAQALLTLSMCNYRLSNRAQALQQGNAALMLFEALDDKKNRALTLNMVGLIHSNLSQLTQALLFYEESLALSEELGDRSGIGLALNNMGIVHFTLGQCGAALEFYFRSLAMFESLGNESKCGAVFANIGSIYFQTDDFPKALEFFQKSFDLRERTGDTWGMALCISNIGEVYSKLGDDTQTLACAQRAMALYESLGDKISAAKQLVGIANVYTRQGDTGQALAYHEEALRLLTALDDKEEVLLSLNGIGALLAQLSRFEEAEGYLSKSMALVEAYGLKRYRAETLQHLADLYTRSQQFEKALETYRLFHLADKELFNEESQQKLQNLQVVFDTEQMRKQSKLAEQQTELAQKQTELAQNQTEPERLRNTDLKAAYERLEDAEEKSRSLLLNILPDAVARRLQAGETMIADRFDNVTVLFADIVGFTTLSAKLSPEALVNILGEVFSLFDDICERNGLEKIKTIGDAYLCVGGLPEPRPDHAEVVAEAALEMIEGLLASDIAQQAKLNVRIGIHTGAVVAGVIGTRKFAYDLWGDTVNTASRMESHGLAGQIQVSDETYRRLEGKYLFGQRGEVSVKGKGVLETYFLTGRTSGAMIS